MLRFFYEYFRFLGIPGSLENSRLFPGFSRSLDTLTTLS